MAKVHEGRNIKRFREMLGIKQEALAAELGDDWNQKKISLLEQKELIEPEILASVASALKVPVEAIKNFDEQSAINIIGNTLTTNDNASASLINYFPSFNPIDRLVESFEENRQLYERLLESERARIILLENLLA
ncbi:MAG: helix-turn-helix transcriptional regulator, partial [Bacteroidota bacterium]|nr:helix-turn-helix transcriptional regulator [Bacteroidota bacterium]